jgi:hypothetical protein
MVWPFNRASKQEEVPSDWDLQQAFDYAPFTPDISVLQQKATQLLFVYDEMMTDFPDHRIIEEYAITCGSVFTKDEFVMYKRKLGQDSYAVALDDSFFVAQKAIIKGQLFAVQSPRFAELDTIYQNGVEFERRRITVRMPYYHFGWRDKTSMFKEYRMQELRCFMYVGVQEHWSNIMGEGDGFFLYERVRTFEPKNPDLTKYYHYSKLEYEDF